jgi:hypothetical protein
VPDARGRFYGITVPGEAWERVFGQRQERLDLVCPTCGGTKWAHGSHDQMPYCTFCLADMDPA